MSDKGAPQENGVPDTAVKVVKAQVVKAQVVKAAVILVVFLGSYAGKLL